MGEFTECSRCGETIEKNGRNKFVSFNAMELAGRQRNSYCSKKCQLEAEPAERGFFSNDLSESSDTDKNEDARKRAVEVEKTETNLEDISKISFNSDVDEIQEILNYLATIGIISKGKDIRFAIMKKMELGIMKLKNAGFINEADYFEEKREIIRPKSFKESTSNAAVVIAGLLSRIKHK